MVTPMIVRRFRAAYVMAVGLMFAAVGFALFTQLDASSGFPMIAIGSVLFSLGFAPLFTLTNDLIIGSAPPERAGMVLERRHQLDEGVGEIRDRVGGELLEHAEVDQHSDDRLARPVVRAAQDARLDDPQGWFRASHAGRVGRSPALLGAVRIEGGLAPGDGRRLGHGFP